MGWYWRGQGPKHETTCQPESCKAQLGLDLSLQLSPSQRQPTTPRSFGFPSWTPRVGAWPSRNLSAASPNPGPGPPSPGDRLTLVLGSSAASRSQVWCLCSLSSAISTFFPRTSSPTAAGSFPTVGPHLAACVMFSESPSQPEFQRLYSFCEVTSAAQLLLAMLWAPDLTPASSLNDPHHSPCVPPPQCLPTTSLFCPPLCLLGLPPLPSPPVTTCMSCWLCLPTRGNGSSTFHNIRTRLTSGPALGLPRCPLLSFCT